MIQMFHSPPTAHRITQFFQWYKEGALELAPPFQRKPVWSEKTKSYLIDSILNEYPVPELYIQVKTYPTGKSRNY